MDPQIPHESEDLAALLARPPHLVAPDLLGMRVRSTVGGQAVTIVLREVEAYGGEGEDAASHAHRGRTARNRSMFARAGTAYIYRSYGIHWCLNVVASTEGHASGCLLRAGIVVEGLEIAQARRPTARRPEHLAAGPGRLGSTLGITGALDGADLLDQSSPLRLLPREPGVEPVVVAGPRVGISREVERPWRWRWM